MLSPSQICNIYLLLATFATKYVIMLNNSNLPLTPLKILGSSCPYSGALQSFNLVFYVNKGLTLITWDIVITTTSIELSNDEKMFLVKMYGLQLLFSSNYYIYCSIYHQEEINYRYIHTHFSCVHNCRTVS